MIDLDQSPQPDRKERPSRIVLALVAVVATIASLLIFVGEFTPRVPTFAASASPRSISAATPTATPTQSPTASPDLPTVVAGLSGELRFVPLLPAPLPSGASAQRHGCGVATSPCVTIHWGSGSPVPRVDILEGPAGCCLDYVRTDARRSTDMEIHAGVWAHWEDLDARFGGPILWWVDRTTPNPLYVAVSSDGAETDTILRIARSLRPLGATIPRETCWACAVRSPQKRSRPRPKYPSRARTTIITITSVRVSITTS